MNDVSGTSPRELAPAASRTPRLSARKPKLRPLRILVPYAMRYRGRAAAALVALLIASAATLVVPVAVRRMIDFGFTEERIGLIDQYFGVMVAIVAVLAIASASRYYLVTSIGERVVADLRSAVFAHLTTLSAAFFDTAKTGEMTSRLTADTTQIKSAVGSSVSVALRNLVLFAGSATMMVITSPKLSGFVLGAIPVIVLPLVAFGRSVRRRSRTAQDTLADASAYAAELIGAIRTLQAFTNEPAAGARFGSAVERAYGARAPIDQGARGADRDHHLSRLGQRRGHPLGRRAGRHRRTHDARHARPVRAVRGVCGERARPVERGLGRAVAGRGLRRAARPSCLPCEPEMRAPAHPVPLAQRPRAEVAFDNVRFAYPARPEADVLDGVSFHVRPGEKVAIVGPSGAGKSTIFHLILRFYDPKSGAVTFDGVRLPDADPAELRRHVALVPQDTAIFAMSVRDNIAFGRPDATDAEIERAAEDAAAASFIRLLPQGYDTPVGERGVTLSGGQRQRIAIARAILKGAPLLLLDEATSSLDAESETLVQTALDPADAGPHDAGDRAPACDGAVLRPDPGAGSAAGSSSRETTTAW